MPSNDGIILKFGEVLPARMRVLSVFVLSLVLAGCSAAPEQDADAADSDDDIHFDVKPTATTGIIKGVVIDEAIRPIAQANVELTPGSGAAATSASGAFGFEGLEPGQYFLQVTKGGYNMTTTPVNVAAGIDPPVTKVLLVRDAAQLPYYREYTWAGYMSHFLLDGQGLSDNDFQVELQLDAKPTHITCEVVWKSTQSIDRTLTQTIYYEGDTAGQVTGESPLFQGISDADLQPGRGDPETITVRVNGQITTLDQGYDVFVHVFYGYAPPSDWRLSSGDPVPPPPGQ